jgi:hypothetical protein
MNSPVNNTQLESVKQSISEELQELKNFANKCKTDAAKSRSLKRLARGSNVFLGIATALIGFAITQDFVKQKNNWNLILGATNAVIGAFVSLSGKNLDPATSRQRAIELQILRHKFRDVGIRKEVEYYKLINEKDSKTIDDYQTLFNNIRNEAGKLETEAYGLGVDV